MTAFSYPDPFLSNEKSKGLGTRMDVTATSSTGKTGPRCVVHALSDMQAVALDVGRRLDFAVAKT